MDIMPPNRERRGSPHPESDQRRFLWPRVRRRTARIANAVAAGLVLWGVKAVGAWLYAMLR